MKRESRWRHFRREIAAHVRSPLRDPCGSGKRAAISHDDLRGNGPGRDLSPPERLERNLVANCEVVSRPPASIHTIGTSQLQVPVVTSPFSSVTST